MTESAKRVLVTGGATGIGGAIVSALAGEGYAVDLTYNSSADRGHALARDLSAANAEAPVTAQACDLSDPAAVEALATRVEGAEQGYYALVHNAGMSYDSLAAMIDVDKGMLAMQVNFWSMVRLVRAVARKMAAARQGRIVAIGSVTATRGNQGNAVYAATKAALLGYVKTLAVEVARRSVTANVIAPGYVDTDMLEGYKHYRKALEKQIPLTRYADPAEIAGLVAYLLSDKGAYINGAELAIDGGLSASLGIKR